MSRRLRSTQGVLGLAVVGYLGRLIYLRLLEVRDVQLSFQWPASLMDCVSLADFYGVYSFGWQQTLHLMDTGGWRRRRLDLYERLGGQLSRGLQSIHYQQISLILGVIVFAEVLLHPSSSFGGPDWLVQE